MLLKGCLLLKSKINIEGNEGVKNERSKQEKRVYILYYSLDMILGGLACGLDNI